MEKFKSGVFVTYMTVSMSVGILASITLLLLDEIAVLPVLGKIIAGAITTALIGGFAFFPLALKIRKIAEGLEAVNSGKRSEKLTTLPFNILGTLIRESNVIIENQTDFQSMRGRLYEQISEVAAQEERNRLARDLHDSIKQQVFSMNVSAAAAYAHLESNPLAAREALVDVRQSAQEAMVEMRVLLQQLAPAPLEQSGLIESMRQQMEAISYRTGAKIETDFDKLPSDEQMPIGAQETLFRITQEALSNIARHARAKQIGLSLKHRKDDSLTLTISDNGQGFDVETVKRGMGLNNMERRIEDLDGELSLSSTPGQGTNLAVRIPLAQKDETVDILETRKKHKKLSEGVYHQYLGFAASVAGIIFAATFSIRAILGNRPLILSIIMAIVAMILMPVSLYLWRRYRSKSQHFKQTVPSADPAHLLVKQHRYESHWIILFASAFVIPAAFIGMTGLLWLPNLIGGILTIGVIRSLGHILLSQHRYLKKLYPGELTEAIQAFRITLTAGIASTVLMILTVVLPGTSTGFYLVLDNREEWDSNFFTGLILIFIAYHVCLLVLYFYWNNIANQNNKEN